MVHSDQDLDCRRVLILILIYTLNSNLYHYHAILHIMNKKHKARLNIDNKNRDSFKDTDELVQISLKIPTKKPIIGMTK
jgi:hypothetical protein